MAVENKRPIWEQMKTPNKNAMKRGGTLLLIFVLSWQALLAQYISLTDANWISFMQATYPACMSGSNMDTACVKNLGATTLTLSNKSLTNISGIQYFRNLTSLNVSQNQLTSVSKWRELPSTMPICFSVQHNRLVYNYREY